MIGGIARIGPEDFLNILQRAGIVAEAALDDGCCVRGTIALGIGDVDHAVGLEVRIQHQAKISCLTFNERFRQAGHGRGGALASSHEFQAAFLLCEQQIAIRQEGETPGPLGLGHDGREFHVKVACCDRRGFSWPATSGNNQCERKQGDDRAHEGVSV